MWSRGSGPPCYEEII
uniref:Uncharacterized protein n=1 Tax=Anguilla anguilla TaxID=7936 RepID=A0A0E9TKX3_ANGAN